VKTDGFAARLISGLVLAPPVIAALYYGSPYFDGLALLVGALMAWEWSRLVSDGKFGAGGWAVAAFSVLAIAASIWEFHQYSLALIFLAPIALFVLLFQKHKGRGAWISFGIIYVGLPLVTLIWLRQDLELGRELIFWIVGVVWATDIGAYFFGRMIGGPLLLPAVSPKKTWAGLLGGMLCAALVGYGASFIMPVSNLSLFVAASGLLAFIAQVGDFFESGVKRKFGVKDSSRLIPGHGGILDRVDGLLTVALAAFAVRYFGEGIII